jgi:calmodulin
MTLKEEAVRQAKSAAEFAQSESSEALAETAPVEPAMQANDNGSGSVLQAPAVVVPHADKILWKSEIPYFNELSLADYDNLMEKAKLLQFESGSILMREGRAGRTFYILQSGEVEICQRSMMGDPLTTPASYLGTVINRFVPGDFFGERALITGEPRAASIRATENITCYAFDKDDFPPSSVLSGRTRNQEDTKELAMVNDKYGVAIADLYQQGVEQQVKDTFTSNQVRGSFNRPEPIRGVDTEEEVAAAAAQEEYGTPGGKGAAAAVGLGVEDDAIFSLLNRFKMVQLVTRCFRYIIRTRAQWGDEGIRTRRSMLVSRLTPSQRAEYRDAFRLIDTSGDGTISLLELKRVMNSIGETKSDDELKEMISKARDAIDDGSVLNLQDFMGIMAETEFYHLFRDIFASMDPNDTGFVKKADLERVLCGVRDLISDDRKSIIDVEDDDMLIDYEQFTRMLLGSALI